MMMRVGMVLLALAAGGWAQTLDIYVIDVEGGNATLFVTPAHDSLLIDTGNAGAVASVRDAMLNYKGYKGAAGSFRTWDRQLRQPILFDEMVHRGLHVCANLPPGPLLYHRPRPGRKALRSSSPTRSWRCLRAPRAATTMEPVSPCRSRRNAPMRSRSLPGPVANDPKRRFTARLLCNAAREACSCPNL